MHVVDVAAIHMYVLKDLLQSYVSITMIPK